MRLQTKSFISMKKHNQVSSLGIPTVMIEYMATWIFINTPATDCDDMSLLLNYTAACSIRRFEIMQHDDGLF